MQPLRVLTSVSVTAAFAKARPTKLPRVSVMAAPERMFPLRSESVCVVAASDHQITLHACAPPARTTERLVPVKAPATLNVQLAVAGPLSVNTPVFASALTQYTPGARVWAASVPVNSAPLHGVAAMLLYALR